MTDLVALCAANTDRCTRAKVASGRSSLPSRASVAGQIQLSDVLMVALRNLRMGSAALFYTVRFGGMASSCRVRHRGADRGCADRQRCICCSLLALMTAVPIIFNGNPAAAKNPTNSVVSTRKKASDGRTSEAIESWCTEARANSK
jgi:hypothetical protein